VTNDSNEYKLALHVVVQQAVEIEQLKNALAKQVARCLDLESELGAARANARDAGIAWRGKK